jgi:hypothetical protein
VSIAGVLFFIGGVWTLLSIIIAEGLNPSYNVFSGSVSGLGVPYFSNNPPTCNTFPSCGIPVQPSSAVLIFSFFLLGATLLWGGYLIRRATSYRLYGLGVSAGGALVLLIAGSYVPFYAGTPTTAVIGADTDLHVAATMAIFILAIVLMISAYALTRRPFRYLSLVLGVVALSVLLLGVSGINPGVGGGTLERVFEFSFLAWMMGFGAYLLGGSGLDSATLRP